MFTGDDGASEPLTDDEQMPPSSLKRSLTLTIDLTGQCVTALGSPIKRRRSEPPAQLLLDRAAAKVTELVAEAEAYRSTGTLAGAMCCLEQAGRIQRIVRLMMEAPS
jgi:hypothetical protein